MCDCSSFRVTFRDGGERERRPARRPRLQPADLRRWRGHVRYPRRGPGTNLWRGGGLLQQPRRHPTHLRRGAVLNTCNEAVGPQWVPRRSHAPLSHAALPCCMLHVHVACVNRVHNATRCLAASRPLIACHAHQAQILQGPTQSSAATPAHLLPLTPTPSCRGLPVGLARGPLLPRKASVASPLPSPLSPLPACLCCVSACLVASVHTVPVDVYP